VLVVLVNIVLHENSQLVSYYDSSLELISVLDGAFSFCMPEFDSVSVRQFIECICTN